MLTAKNLATVILCGLVAACGGGSSASGGSESGGSSSTKFQPQTNAANATFQGTAATGAALSLIPVIAYDAKGETCGKGTTAENGTFSFTGKCIFPVLLAADTPELQGKRIFSVIPTIDEDGQKVAINLTPLTTALVYITNNGSPVIGGKLSPTSYSQVRIDSAQTKLKELLQPLMKALNIESNQNFQNGQITIGQGQDILLDQLTVSFETISSTKQNILRVNLTTENRPITIVQDSNDPASLRIDLGLGMTPSAVDPDRLAKAQSIIKDLGLMINGKTMPQLNESLDVCFLHNGSKNKVSALFDADMPWGDVTPVAKNLRLIRFNTRTNFDNNTEENLNDGEGDLAFVSFDFVTPRGALTRTYTWLARNDQTIRDCSSKGSPWKIIGNQRPVYIRTSAYAIHKIDYNSAFAGRIDTFGSGIETFIDSGTSDYSYALVSGPGLPKDGVVYLKTDGSYLVAKTSPLDIRKAYVTLKGTEKCDLACLLDNPKESLARIFDTVVDTKSALIPDSDIRLIQDSFFGNSYIIRLFKKYDDLFPSLTVEEVLPKRPQLSTEMKAINYPSLGVNLDNLVTSLQLATPVQINWSLPLDSRGLPLESFRSGFYRLNCSDKTKWPNCTKRSQQTNEFWFSDTYIDKGLMSISMTPDQAIPTETKTVESRVRLKVLDTLNRPLEVSVGMTYSR